MIKVSQLVCIMSQQTPQEFVMYISEDKRDEIVNRLLELQKKILEKEERERNSYNASAPKQTNTINNE